MSAMGYLLQLWPTNELYMEAFCKDAQAKKREREKRKSLRIFMTPAALREHRSLRDNHTSNPDSPADPVHYELPFANGSLVEPTVSVPSRRALAQLLQLLTCAPIVDGIVSHCSASMLANFFCALEMKLPSSLRNHITPLRDIFTPPELKQVRQLGRLNHTVIAMGKDLHNIWKKILDPEKYYADPDRQTKFHVWVVIVQKSYTPPHLEGVLSGPMTESTIPGEWMLGPSSRNSRLCLPARAVKWNSAPAVHVEWYLDKFHRTTPLNYSFALPTEVTTSGFMWDWDRKKENPVLQYINTRRNPYSIYRDPFENLGHFPDASGRFGVCRHYLIIRLGESCNPLGDWNIPIRISSCCKRPECAKPPWARGGRVWECCSCNGPH